jgi:hypothetical protein
MIVDIKNKQFDPQKNLAHLKENPTLSADLMERVIERKFFNAREAPYQTRTHRPFPT